MTHSWDPWAAPAPATPRRGNATVVSLACAITVVLAAGVVSLAGRAIADAAERDRVREARQEDEADKRFDEALQATPDTASVSPLPDGSKRYDTQARGSDQHAFHVTLPRGWEGKYLGSQDSDVVFSDSLLTGPHGVIIVNRIDVDPRAVQSREFPEQLERELERGEGLDITESWTATTVGDDERAHRVQGTLAQEGDEFTVRVIVLVHGGETFRIDLTALSPEWRKALPEFDRVLASWRWG